MILMRYTDTDSEDDLEDRYFNEYKEEKQMQTQMQRQLSLGEKSNIIFSKIAMEEEDYQYIIHPKKKPIKYGYMDGRNINNNRSESKVAMDDNMIYPPHIQYMQQYQYGGSYIIQRMMYLSIILIMNGTYSYIQKTYHTNHIIHCALIKGAVFIILKPKTYPIS